MKLLFFGAGAIGSAVGGKLANFGADVTLVARPAHAKAIREGGLQIRGLWGDILAHPRATDNLREIEGESFDAVFITVKSYDTQNACKLIREAKIRAKVFIPMQNGLGNLETASRFFDTVAGAVVTFGSVLEKPGQIRVTVWGQDIMFGRFKGNADVLEELVKLFCDAGLPSRLVDDILTPLWLKVTYNCALNPLSAIFRTTYGEVMKNPELRQIGERVIEECIAVAKLEGVPVPSADDFKKLFFEVLLPQTQNHISSMVQDIERGRRTEIDALCGEVWQRGKKHEFDARVNWMLWKIVRALESKHKFEKKGK